MEPTQGLEQSLLLLAPAPGTIREGARRATARNCCCYTSSTTAHAKTKRAPRTEEGYRPGWAFSISFFAICEVEMEGAIRVGEHRLRHQGQGQPGRTRRSSRLAAERRGRLMYRRGGRDCSVATQLHRLYGAWEQSSRAWTHRPRRRSLPAVVQGLSTRVGMVMVCEEQ